MKQQAWPGNLRELRNVVERAAVHSNDGVIRLANLSVSGLLAMSGATSQARTVIDLAVEVAPSDGDSSLAAAEARHIGRILLRTRGNKSEAARVLGITRQTLLRKMREYALPDGAG